MLKGFLTGTLTLIVIYVAVQEGPSKKAGEASNVLVAGMRRLLSPSVAGLGAHGGTPTGSTATPTKVTATTPTTGIYFQNL